MTTDEAKLLYERLFIPFPHLRIWTRTMIFNHNSGRKAERNR